MNSTSLIIEMLKQKQFITSLEKDILDTYHELYKKPFDRDFAIKKTIENNANHPDIFIAISTSPTTVFKPWADASDEDVYSNLTSQLGALVEKESKVLKRG